MTAPLVLGVRALRRRARHTWSDQHGFTLIELLVVIIVLGLLVGLVGPRLFGRVGQLFGIFTASFDEHGINTGVDEATTGTRGLGRVMSDLHSGQIQTYLGAIAIGMLALLILAWLI